MNAVLVTDLVNQVFASTMDTGSDWEGPGPRRAFLVRAHTLTV